MLLNETDTIDYIILLKGDVLILDEEEVRLKPHDVVVQRRTNHAWVHEPALLIAVLIDSVFTKLKFSLLDIQKNCNQGVFYLYH